MPKARPFPRAIATGRRTSLRLSIRAFRSSAESLFPSRSRTGRAFSQMIAASGTKPVSSHDVAITYAALGDKDKAFEWLTRACDERSEHVPYLNVNPRVDPLRTDPRFHDLLQRLALVG